jgi:hypothetical protein
MWVFTVLLPVTIVLWKSPVAVNMDMAWHDWVFFAAALMGTPLDIRALPVDDCAHTDQSALVLCFFRVVFATNF